VPVYLSACASLLIRATGRADALFSAIASAPLNVVRLLWFVVLANWGMSFLRVIHCMTVGRDTGWSMAFAVFETAATVAAIWVMLAPAVGTPPAPTKYGKSSLDDPARARIRRKLDEAFSGARVHLDNGLTFDGLCAHLRENPHYVSQVLNQDLGRSFYELINLQRVESAKRALVEAPTRSILEIAMDAGFNSKTTFNTAFRQHTGVTPTHYRRSMRDVGDTAQARVTTVPG
jgi:AraC-like DNA-binding protein